MTTRHAWATVLASVIGVAVLFLLLPSIALADNCSGLSDCWSTAAGAASAAVGAAFGALGGLFGGLGGDGEDDGDGEGDGSGDDSGDGGPPQNDDPPDPWPC